MSLRVAVTGAFDELRSRGIRFLEEAARWGELEVWLWPDALVERELGRAPKFPEAERLYFLRALRFVAEAKLMPEGGQKAAFLNIAGTKRNIVAVREGCAGVPSLCAAAGVECRVIPERHLDGWPYCPPDGANPASARKKVLVTGCYDWFHSGHVRFFEEVSAFGDLYVVVGHDENIRLLKGEGHPMFCQEERRYMVGAVRFVKQALISSGNGWLDAEPEIERLKPDIYAVNEDGDRGGKREFCQAHGMEYLVLKRAPAPGLPRRTSTNLRGF